MKFKHVIKGFSGCPKRKNGSKLKFNTSFISVKYLPWITFKLKNKTSLNRSIYLFLLIPSLSGSITNSGKMKVSFTYHTIKYIINFTMEKKLQAYFDAQKKDLTPRTILPPED